MLMKGEKYPFPGYPRGSILFGKLSKLKHEIKNQIFNTAWNLLEMGTSEEEVRSYLKQAWLDIFILAETMKYDFPPPERLVPAIKELHRSMTVAGVDPRIRDIICLILHEDDAYRFRFQWLVKFFPRWRKPRLEDFAAACGMAEHAEMIGDMKERQRLFKRIMLLMADGSPVFEKFLKETKWRRVRLSKADKYFFRANKARSN